MNFNIKKVLLIVTVPLEYLDSLRNSICQCGAGTIGNYSFCSLITHSTGTFKPNNLANPFVGGKNKVNYVEEEKLEIICDLANVKKVLNTIKKIHPYEEPIINIIPLLDEENF